MNFMKLMTSCDLKIVIITGFTRVFSIARMNTTIAKLKIESYAFQRYVSFLSLSLSLYLYVVWAKEHWTTIPMESIAGESSEKHQAISMSNSIISTGILDESEPELILPKPVLSLQTLDDDTEAVIIMSPKSMETEKESAEMEGDKYESVTDMSISSGDEPILTEVPKQKGHMPHALIPLEKVNNIRSRQAIIRSIKSVIGEKRRLEKPWRQIPGVPASKLSTFHIISCLLYDALALIQFFP